jgi:hypothetical protein
MSKAKIAAVEKRLIRIRSEITAIGSFLPGSITKQYNVCGNKNCKCKDSVNPKKHGPYFQLAFYKKGKHSTAFIPKEIAKDVKNEVQNYKRAKKLMDLWINLQLEAAMLKIGIVKKEKLLARKKT